MRKLMAAVSFAGLFVCAALTTARAEPTPLWTVNFDSVGTVPQRAVSRPELASAGVGSGLILSVPLGGISRFASIAKIDVDGTAVWLGQHTSYSYFYGTVAETLVLSDGSVIVIADAVYRYSSNGQLAWVAPLLSTSAEVIEVGSRLFMASPNSGQPAAVIDLASGKTLEMLSSANVGFGQDVGLAAVGNDTIYAYTAQGMWVHKFRLNPLRVEWSVSLEGTLAPHETTLPCCTISSIVADESGAYVSGSSVVAKVAPADGSLLWSQSTTPDYALTLAADASSPADILAVSPNIVTSIARTSGVRLWTHVPPAAISAFATFDDSVAVVGNTDPNAPASNPGFLERIHRDDGTVVWQQPVTGSPATTSSVSGVAVDGDRIAASGVQCETRQVPELCELVIWHISVDGGAVAMVKPVFPQSVEYAGSAGDGVSTVAAALVATATGQQILVRRIQDSDGVVLWETSIPASLANASGQAISELNIQLTHSASSDVVIAYGRRPNTIFSTEPLGDTMVSKLDGSSGAVQWQRSLLDTSGGYTDTSVNTFIVTTDTAGNVFASVHEVASNPSPSTAPIPNRREIRKYSAATGDELLRLAFAPTQAVFPQFQFLPVNFQIVGDIVLTEEGPLPQSAYGSYAIDGTTGSVICNNFPLDIFQPIRVEGSNAIAADSVSTSPPLIKLTRVDAPTCSVVWQSNYNYSADLRYSASTLLLGSDNGFYAGNQARIADGSIVSGRPYPLMLRADAASGLITWVNRFESNPVISPLRPRPLFISDGLLRALQTSYRAGSSNGQFLTSLSPADGTFQGTSSLTFDNQEWPQLPMTTLGIQGLAADGGMIVRRYGDSPGESTRFSLGKLPLPQPFAGGSLRVSMHTSVATGAIQNTFSFRFDVVNNGTVSADAVEAIVGLPKPSIIDSVGCTIAGSPCVAEATSSYVRNVANIGIGENLVLTGTVRTWLPPYGTSFEASAFSTSGLVEMDMTDNIASIKLYEILFSSGFDQ